MQNYSTFPRNFLRKPLLIFSRSILHGADDPDYYYEYYYIVYLLFLCVEMGNSHRCMGYCGVPVSGWREWVYW